MVIADITVVRCRIIMAKIAIRVCICKRILSERHARMSRKLLIKISGNYLRSSLKIRTFAGILIMTQTSMGYRGAQQRKTVKTGGEKRFSGNRKAFDSLIVFDIF